MLRATSFALLLALFFNRAACQELSRNGRPRGATVTGVAIDSIHDDYLAGASVSVSGTTLSATTDSVGEFRIAGIPEGEDGTFTLSGLRPGTRTVSVRKIGYEPASAAIELQSGEARRINLTLGQSVTLLKAMIVTAARDA
jgi:hypothetical protein